MARFVDYESSKGHFAGLIPAASLSIDWLWMVLKKSGLVGYIQRDPDYWLFLEYSLKWPTEQTWRTL